MTVATPTTAALLVAWERARGLSGPWRGVALLSAVLPDASSETLAALCRGERDRYLLDLRTRVFGPRAQLVSDCPECGARVQFGGTLDPPDPVPEAEAAEISVDGFRLSVRPPALSDLADAAATGDREAARRLLLARSVIVAVGESGEVSPEALPEHVVTAVEAALAEADPPAVPEIPLTCPDCRVRWTAHLDVEAFLWEELDAWAGRILREVAALARTFGWREADVLALSAWRRRAYLELAGI